jgi:hypothetical protein
MDLKEVGWEVVHWINLAHDRDERQAGVNIVLKLRAS